jgi:hypothetical protein
MLFGNSENPHRGNAGLNISLSSNVRKALFMLAGISQVLWFENLVSIKDPIESSIRTHSFGLTHNLRF